jgi:hypothetical protein
MKFLSGLDHVVILVRDLDMTAASGKRLRFTTLGPVDLTQLLQSHDHLP